MSLRPSVGRAELLAALEAGELPALTGGFQALIGYGVRRDPARGAYVELEVGERHLNNYGVGHGGLVLVLLDTIGGVTCFLEVADAARVATVSLSANFIRAVEPGRVVARGRLDHAGTTIGFAAMEVRAGGFDGPLLATATGTFRLFRAASG